MLDSGRAEEICQNWLYAGYDVTREMKYLDW
jgi:hypothetical protein